MTRALRATMNKAITVPAPYRRSLHVAVVTQVVAVLMSALVDDNGWFMGIVFGGWIVFWVGAVFLMRYRARPKWVELAGLRYGPLAIPVGVFVASQYL